MLLLAMNSNQVQEKENNSGSRKRHMVDWNGKNHDTFVKVCVGNRPHTHFNKMGQANVIKNFN